MRPVRAARDGGFDRVAAIYPWLERLSFGGGLQRARSYFVGRVAPRRVLLLGEGEGRLARVMARAWPEAQLTIVDASARQLARARRRLVRAGAAERVRFLQRDLLAFDDYRAERDPNASFDCVATPFVLDCFVGAELERVVASISRQVAECAWWLHADFVPPARGVLGLRQRLWTGALYRFFARSAGLEARRLEDPSAALRRAGFEEVDERRFRLALLHAQLWQRGTGLATMRGDAGHAATG